ncbi:45814_t:CDS:2, partial [Gigaspora margarita]
TTNNLQNKSINLNNDICVYFNLLINEYPDQEDQLEKIEQSKQSMVNEEPMIIKEYIAKKYIDINIILFTFNAMEYLF